MKRKRKIKFHIIFFAVEGNELLDAIYQNSFSLENRRRNFHTQPHSHLSYSRRYSKLVIFTRLHTFFKQNMCCSSYCEEKKNPPPASHMSSDKLRKSVFGFLSSESHLISTHFPNKSVNDRIFIAAKFLILARASHVQNEDFP